MIKINDVNKVLSKKQILTDINIEFEEGKVYLLRGHNGCGKTMLLRLICGLISPTSGSVETDKDYRFGVVIENPSFFEGDTGLSNMKYLASINKLINIKEIERYLDMLNLSDMKNKKVKSYSLGMKQRLALCQAFMENPDVILLDEPFNAIDDDNLKVVYRIVNELKEQGKIIVIAAHGDLSESEIAFDKVITMSAGKITKIEEL